jgi:hypothetical protein
MQTRGRLILILLVALTLAPLTTAPAGDKVPSKALPSLWEYRVIPIELSKISRELNKLGLEGWELVTAQPDIRDRFGGADNPSYVLFLKRRLKGPPEKDALTGVWKLTNADKHGLVELHMECYIDRTVRVWGKGPMAFEFDGQYELGKEQVRFRLSHGTRTEENVDKLKKLTPTELILENEQGKIEEYQRVK